MNIFGRHMANHRVNKVRLPKTDLGDRPWVYDFADAKVDAVPTLMPE